MVQFSQYSDILRIVILNFLSFYLVLLECFGPMKMLKSLTKGSLQIVHIVIQKYRKYPKLQFLFFFTRYSTSYFII